MGIFVSGTIAEPQVVEGLGEIGEFESKSRISVLSQRDGVEELPLHLEDSDLVFLEFQNGFCEVLTKEEFEKRLPPPSRDGKNLVSSSFPIGNSDRLKSGTRGIGNFGLKLIEVIAPKLLGLAAAEIFRRLDKWILAEPGLFRLGAHTGETERWSSSRRAEDDFSVRLVEQDDRPYLLLIHGTISSTQGGFAGLGQGQRWESILKEDYQDRVIAFDHPTLSVSPLVNTIELLRALPTGCRLHLVTHSRGGLIGELLCQDVSKFDAADVRFFKDQAEFEEYRNLLALKRPRIDRFVRVACPALGTTLASKRPDKYLSTILNAAIYASRLSSLVTGNPTGLALEPLIAKIKFVLMTVVNLKSDPSVLPGLEAMMPESSFIAFLNRPDRVLNAPLTVIASAFKDRAGFKGAVAAQALDLLFLEEHDLVVPTRSMFGGTPRAAARKYIATVSPVDHFSFFFDDTTFGRIRVALKEGDKEFDALGSFDFAKDTSVLGCALTYLSRAREGEINYKRPYVFVIPGAMGSHLVHEGQSMWLSYKNLVLGKFVGLKLSESASKNPKLKPSSVLSDYYGKLAEYLAQTHNVETFPYDWRLSSLDEVGRLADKVQEALIKLPPDQPMRIVCHSMGGLLTRAMLSLYPNIWEQLRRRPNSRILMLGVPNQGSFAALEMLTGGHGTISAITLADVFHSQEQILDTIRSFPGLLQLVPPSPVTDWPKVLRRDVYSKTALEQHQTFWKLVEKAVDPNLMVYVAGLDKRTPIAWTDKTRLISGAPVFDVTEEGDGTVPWDRGELPGVSMLYNCRVNHGNLPADVGAFPAYLELLEEGTTSHSSLLNKKPTLDLIRSSVQSIGEPHEVYVFPDACALQCHIMGGGRPLPTEAVSSTLEIVVTHGDLAYATYPVVVGHYWQQPLEGSEATLDRHLKGRLSADRRGGVYPGPEQTCRVVFQSESHLKGAVIIGLGDFGKLSPGSLVRALRQGIVEFGLRRADYQPQMPSALSFLLIGSQEGGVGRAESVQCLLQALVQANETLVFELNLEPIKFVEVIELYQDRAVDVVRALERLEKLPDFKGVVKVRPDFRLMPGHRRRVSNEPALSSWRRLQITRCKDQLQFVAYSNSAGNEQSSVDLTPGLVDDLLLSATSSVGWNAAVSKALFELLVSNRLKGASDDDRDLLLLLDAETAVYPWELLVDSLNSGRRPLSVRAGMIRQLTTKYYRENVSYGTNPTALVVGDTPSGFSVLEGAQREAKLVGGKLGVAFNVVTLVRPSPLEVMTNLFAQPLQILHIAGHGDFSRTPEGAIHSGVVLSKGLFLTAGTIRQMPACPELVFLNCCHLGNMQEESNRNYSRHEFAANLGTELIRMGARAVIVAGWAVDDKSASVFAESFYQSLLQGENFNRAVHAAREVTYLENSTNNTWGAYQCYGDPDYTLRPGRSQLKSNSWKPLTTAEFICELDCIAQQAEVAGPSCRTGFLRQISDLHQRALEDGLASGACEQDVNLALSRAYRELIHPLFGLRHTGLKFQNFEDPTQLEDVLCVDEALTKSLEFFRKLANSQIVTYDDISLALRLELLELWLVPKSKLARTETEILKDRLTMAELRKTHKALSRVCGAYWLSYLKSPTAESLQAMNEYAKKSWELKQEEDFYTDTLLMTGLALKWLKANEIHPVALSNAQATIPESRGDDLLSSVSSFRRRLLLTLINGGLEDVTSKELLKEISKAVVRGGSPFKLRAILELLEFLVLAAKNGRKKSAPDENTIGALQTLYKGIVNLVSPSAKS